MLLGEYDLTSDTDCEENGICAPRSIIRGISKITEHPGWIGKEAKFSVQNFTTRLCLF